MVAICFENRLAMATRNRIEGGGDQADGNFVPADLEVERELVFLVVALEAQHQHAERFQEEAPDHAERVGFAEQVDVAAAERQW